MTTVSDFLVAHLERRGVGHIFLVTGGGAMHLNDSIGRSPHIQYICNHHEQACAMAAEGYARVTGDVAVINVTTGPGGINALNGVFGAWTDSIPMLVLSGQVKRETLMASYPELKLRQLGYQEADIIALARPITKYAALVMEPESIRYHLERALWLATHGRPGPVWLDIPVDVQAARVDPASLRGYNPAEDDPGYDAARLREQCAGVLRLIERARRPLLVGGNGVRQAGAAAVAAFRRLADSLGIPVVTSRTATDLVPSGHAAHAGRFGADNGTRPGNFAVQNADLLVVVGCRMQVVQTGYNFAAFAPRALIVQVDADTAEMRKPTVRPHVAIHADAREFLEGLEAASREATAARPEWVAWCRERVRRYPPVVRPRMEDPARPLNPYVFLEYLFARLPDGETIACANGAAFVMSSQVAWIRPNQRFFFNSGSASMGHGLPAAIGASLARGRGRVICIEGDGSLQMNVQELATVAHYRLPLKIFVLNNGGYLSIRSTQRNFFGRMVGESAASGVGLPDYVALARAYGIEAVRLDRSSYDGGVQAALDADGPVLAEVMVDGEQPFEPRLMARRREDGAIFSPGLEDLWPNLSEAELAANRIADDDTATRGDLRRLAAALAGEAVPVEPVAR